MQYNFGQYHYLEVTGPNFNKVKAKYFTYDKYAVIADTSDYKRTLCHELMHSLEDGVSAKNKKIFK